MMASMHPLAVTWLDRVELLSRGLPPDQRAELLADLREHLEAALPGDASSARARAAIERLGDPGDVVAAAWDGIPESHAGDFATSVADQRTAEAVPDGWEVASLVALVLAGLVAFYFGGLNGGGIVGLILGFPVWTIGMIVLVTKTRWTGPERLLALCLPLTFVLAIGLVAAIPVDPSSQPVDSATCQPVAGNGSTESRCTDMSGTPVDADGYRLDADGERVSQPFDWRLPVVLVLPPLLSFAIIRWLVRRLRGRHATPRPSTAT